MGGLTRLKEDESSSRGTAGRQQTRKRLWTSPRNSVSWRGCRGEPGGLFRALLLRLQGAQETRAQKLPSGLTWGGAKGHRQLPSRARSGSTVACLPGS